MCTKRKFKKCFELDLVMSLLICVVIFIVIIVALSKINIFFESSETQIPSLPTELDIVNTSGSSMKTSACTSTNMSECSYIINKPWSTTNTSLCSSMTKLPQIGTKTTPIFENDFKTQSKMKTYNAVNTNFSINLKPITSSQSEKIIDKLNNINIKNLNFRKITIAQFNAVQFANISINPSNNIKVYNLGSQVKSLADPVIIYLFMFNALSTDFLYRNNVIDELNKYNDMCKLVNKIRQNTSDYCKSPLINDNINCDIGTYIEALGNIFSESKLECVNWQSRNEYDFEVKYLKLTWIFIKVYEYMHPKEFKLINCGKSINSKTNFEGNISLSNGTEKNNKAIINNGVITGNNNKVVGNENIHIFFKTYAKDFNLFNEDFNDYEREEILTCSNNSSFNIDLYDNFQFKLSDLLFLSRYFNIDIILVIYNMFNDTTHSMNISKFEGKTSSTAMFIVVTLKPDGNNNFKLLFGNTCE